MSDGIAVGDLTDSSRGQLLIIIGLLLATVFIALAVVVNSGIYTENLATRENTDPEAIAIEQASLDRGILETVNEANANVETNTYTDLMAEFDANLAVYNSSLEAEYGSDGRYLQVNRTDAKQGVRLRQTNESRNMTSKHGDWNWTLTDAEVEESGHFTMNLQEGSLYEMTLDTTLSAMADSAYGVEFNLSNYTGSGDGVWRVYFFSGAATDNIYAIVEKPNQTFEDNTTDAINDGYLSQSCALQGDSVSVRLNQSTYGGLYCDDFDFYGSDIGKHTLRFVNAVSDTDPTDTLPGDNTTDRAHGAYDIMLDAHPPNTTAFHGVGGGQPWHQSAIYRINYSLTYYSSETTYTADERVVYPTKSDPGGVIAQHPDIDEFNVTNVTDTKDHPAYDVEWAVSDSDRDLERVELHMIHESSENITDEKTISVSNGSASGTDLLEDDSLLGAIGDDYRIQITVVDTSGRATTDSEVH